MDTLTAKKPTQDAAMPRSLPKWLKIAYLGGLLSIFGLIVLHAPLTVFFSAHFPHHALLIKAWKELLMGLLLIVAIVIVTLTRTWRVFVKDRLLWSSLALAVLYVVSLEYNHGFKPYAAGLLIDVRYVLYFVLVYVAVKLWPETRRAFVRVGLIGAIVVIGFGLLQFVLPRDFLSVLGYSVNTITPYTTIDSYQGLVRLQSTLRGPNPLGAYAMMVALVAGVYVARVWRGNRRRAWLAIILTVAALVVLYASYSRAAYIGLIVGALLIAALLVGKKRLLRPKVIATTVGVCIVIMAGLFAVHQTSFYQSVFKHEVAGSGPAVNSDLGHQLSVTQALASVAKQPFGYGTGSTGSASLLGSNGDVVENQFLFVVHEAGWVALGVFLYLVGAVLVRAARQRADWLAVGVLASGIGLLVVGLFLPVFADDTVSIVWFGLAGIVYGKRTTH